MAHRERINPKTGEKEYKVRYYFMKEGKKRDSETAWFSTLAKAQKEAERMKKEKERADRNNRLQRRDKLLVTVFEEFIGDLKKELPKQESITAGKLYSVALAIRNKHMPNEIQNVKVKDLETLTFKAWHSHINNKDTISGQYMRACRDILFKFNNWMAENNYYNDGFMEESMANAISRCRVKKKDYRNKESMGERSIVTILDIEKITDYYYNNGLEVFENFYYYTLFYVLFYSGVRVEELCALQWKFIDLRESYRTISILNAISDKEQKKHALERTKKGLYKTKSATSTRIIPIFDYYYELLLDYKESFRYEYDLSDDEIEECFVFPHLSVKHNPEVCMTASNIRVELQSTLRKLGMNKTDLQMFRHSCATFLVLPPPDGLGYTEEKVKDYFGHQDTSMLTRVYAKLTTIQKAERMRLTFSEIYKPKEKDLLDIQEKMKLRLLARISGDNDEAMESRRNRIYGQINRAIEHGREKYCYNTRDKKIVEEYISENGSDRIEFVYVKE